MENRVVVEMVEKKDNLLVALMAELMVGWKV
jgi:hypothetical protein